MVLSLLTSVLYDPGLVCERIRQPDDVDMLKWYVPNTNEILHEESFHCSDINTQLKAVIEGFMASPHKERLNVPRIEPEVSQVLHPFSLATRIQEAVASVEAHDQAGTMATVRIVSGDFTVDLFIGRGRSELSLSTSDYFVMQKGGSSLVSTAGTAGCGEAGGVSDLELLEGMASFFPLTPDGTAIIQQDSADSVLVAIACSK